jgi:hypothetical protein
MTTQDRLPQSLTLQLPVAPAYGDEAAQLVEQTITVTLDLSGGPRTFQSQAKAIGSYRGVEVKARLSFGYDYDKEESKLTIRGNDDRTPQQLCITTFLSGAPDQAFDHAPSLVFHTVPNDIGQNRQLLNVWADHVGQRPAFVGALQDVARRCNDMLIKAAIDAGISSVLELGTAPVVTLDNLDDFKRMFGEPVVSETAIDKVADVIRMQSKVFSIYVGTVTWAGNTLFANVIGSTEDPKPSDVKSWLELWCEKCHGGNNPTRCSSYDFFSKDTTWKCSDVFVGGHVIKGTTAMRMAKGSTVFIYPICNKHNGSDPNYMKLLYNPKGVQLKYWDVRAGQ